MLVLKSSLFEKISGIRFGFSTKVGNGKAAPYYFNMSLSVDDDKESVIDNRRLFFSSLGLDESSVAIQKQVHGDNIVYVDSGRTKGESDAMITDKPGLGLAVSTADCTPIFIYDCKKKVIAGIHSGWRSTRLLIVQKTVERLKKDFNSAPEDLIVYIGPSISQKNYEVGQEVAAQFDGKYTLQKENGKYLLDVAGASYDMLVESGVKKENMQKSVLCTYEMKSLLHSYRRDGLNSGRALGVIVMDGKKL